MDKRTVLEGKDVMGEEGSEGMSAANGPKTWSSTMGAGDG